MTPPENHKDNLRELAHAERASYLATLTDLVELESPTHDKAANDRVADHLQALLEKDGWQLERVPKTEVGDQLLAHSEAPGDSSTLLLCHFDTVWALGTLDRMPLKEEEGKLYGPGTLDMKAGVTTAVYAVRLARANNLTLKGPVTLLLTSDEETGSLHSSELIETEAVKHDRVLVLEPGKGDGALKIGRKGTGGFTVRFVGISSHAGNEPEAGASALRELAHFIPFAEKLSDLEKGTTVNVTVAFGGSTSNVIAEEAQCSIDLRVMKAVEAERVTQALQAYEVNDARVSVEVLGGLNRPPLELTDANKALFEEAQAAASVWGLELTGAVVGGGSDGNFTSALGIPTLDGLGSVGVGPHARNEHIRIDETLDRLALVTALITKE